MPTNLPVIVFFSISVLLRQIAEFTGTFDGVEEISAELRESIVNYNQRTDILEVFCDRLDGKSLLFQLLYLPYGVGGHHTTFTSCHNAACFNEFFLQRVDYD